MIGAYIIVVFVNNIMIIFISSFAFSVQWEMTKGADIIQTKFHKSIIKSRVGFH